MPEIAEVARIVHYIRVHLVGKTLSNVVAVDDANVYGKVGTSGPEFQKSLAGRKIVGAGQQGKYFWLVMDKPPHPLMHFGMTGWLKIKGQDTYYYRKKESEDDGDGDGEEWPPRFWKFHLATEEEKGQQQHVKAAFVDSRRFARIRLIDCAAGDIRKVSPLKENGPDPVVDRELVTMEWVVQLCRKKKIPIKALLLDQANVSGIGNWVGDEIMYHAKIHPEQYSNTLSDDQLARLHDSMHYVCGTAVDLLADSDRFPEEWLFKHRWGKGKKDAPKTLPNGNKITFLTVGGRTSAVVPSVQKKTGQVAGEICDVKVAGDEEAQDGDEVQERDAKVARARHKGKRTHEKTQDAAAIDEELKVNGTAREPGSAKRPRKSKFKEELTDDEAKSTARRETESKRKKPMKEEDSEGAVANGVKTPKSDKASAKKKQTKTSKGKAFSVALEGKRRSTRLSRG